MPKNNNAIEDELYFTIGQVAKEIGVVPRTIRNWEKHGLFTATRSESEYRLYTLKDISDLRNIKKYSKEKHMGINAIRLLYADSNSEHFSLPQQEDIVISKSKMSGKWHEIRIERGLVLSDVAKALEVSPSYLSKIENGKANASFDVIEKLSKYYSVNINDYIETTEESKSLMVKKGTGIKFSAVTKGITMESLTNHESYTLIPMLYSVEPGAGRPRAAVHRGEEFLYVLKGKIEMTIGEEVYLLSSGDSLLYRSDEKHFWKNTSNVVAKVVWVFTPLVNKK